jgi:hypothetical protein
MVLKVRSTPQPILIGNLSDSITVPSRPGFLTKDDNGIPKPGPAARSWDACSELAKPGRRGALADQGLAHCGPLARKLL